MPPTGGSVNSVDAYSTPPTPLPIAPTNTNQSASGSEGTSAGANQAAYSKSTSVPAQAPVANPSAPHAQLNQYSPPVAKADNSPLSGLPWWLAPAIVASLGAFFMAVMVFYYRAPPIFAPAQPVSGPIATPIYLSDSRLALMNELSQTERIPTDIAIRLGKSKSTVVEQLDELCSLGLVERLAQPGKKFVFYRLSRSGRQALLQQADEQRRPAPPAWPI